MSCRSLRGFLAFLSVIAILVTVMFTVSGWFTGHLNAINVFNPYNPGDYNVLVYAFVPYRDNNITLAGTMGPEAMTPVQDMEVVWGKVFRGIKPKVFMGFYKGYDYILAIASDVRLMVSRINSTYYNVSLIMENVTITMTKPLDSHNGAPAIAGKFRFSGLLHEEKNPIPSFEDIKVYRIGIVSCVVHVDFEKGFYYHDGEFMGSWPFMVRTDSKVLFQVLPKAFFVGVEANDMIFNQYGVSGFVSVYALSSTVQGEIEPVKIVVDGSVEYVNKDSIVMASPVSASQLSSVEKRIVNMRSGGVEVPVTLLEVDGKTYAAIDPRTPLAQFMLYYDNRTGLLIEERLSDAILKLPGGSVPRGIYSFMIPTPLYESLGENVQIFMVPLDGNNALKMVLLEARYTS